MNDLDAVTFYVSWFRNGFWTSKLELYIQLSLTYAHFLHHWYKIISCCTLRAMRHSVAVSLSQYKYSYLLGKPQSFSPLVLKHCFRYWSGSDLNPPSWILDYWLSWEYSFQNCPFWQKICTNHGGVLFGTLIVMWTRLDAMSVALSWEA